MKTLESIILSYLLNALWQIPLIFAAAWVAARALRSAGPGLQHRAWVFALLLQSLLPIASTVSWQWMRTRFLWGSAPSQPGEAHVSVVMGAGTAINVLHLPALLLATIAIAYIAVSFYFAARFLYRCFRLRTILTESVPLTLTGPAAETWAQCAQGLALQQVSIVASSRIFSPVTLGLRHKIILLPDGMIDTLPDADLRTVIAHECAHIERNDFSKNLIYELLFIPASFHPLFWLTRKEVMETREMICDQIAATLAGRRPYAQSLLRLASLLLRDSAAMTPHAIGIFDAHTFERRLMRLAHNQPEMRTTRRLAIVAACVALGLTTCVSALALRIHVDAAAGPAGQNAAQPSGNHSVSSAEMAEHKIGGPVPKYPEEAKKAKIEGTIVLNAVISKEGTVENHVIVSGPKELQASSLDAVRQWTYRPYLIDGNPVDVDTTINVIYSLAK